VKRRVRRRRLGRLGRRGRRRRRLVNVTANAHSLGGELLGKEERKEGKEEGKSVKNGVSRT